MRQGDGERKGRLNGTEMVMPENFLKLFKTAITDSRSLLNPKYNKKNGVFRHTEAKTHQRKTLSLSLKE